MDGWVGGEDSQRGRERGEGRRQVAHMRQYVLRGQTCLSSSFRFYRAESSLLIRERKGGWPVLLVATLVLIVATPGLALIVATPGLALIVLTPVYRRCC